VPAIFPCRMRPESCRAARAPPTSRQGRHS